MKKLLFLILIFCACEKPPDLSGEWEGMAFGVNCSFIIAQEYNKLTGEFAFEGIAADPFIGYIRGNAVTMTVTYPYLSLVFTGETDFSKISGKAEWIVGDTVRVTENFCVYKKK